MAEAFDVIAVGSGHNGLVAAAYLARAGKRVLVAERNPWFGGGVVTRELTVPGVRHDQHSMAHIFIQANPLLKADELGLISEFGLRYVFPEAPMISVFEDGQTLALHRDRNRTAEEIARFSAKDAEAFLRLSQMAATFLPMMTATLYSPPMPLGASYALMDQSREGRELWRLMQLSVHELVCETFEHDRVRAHFARIAGENLVAPDEKATGIGVFVFVGFLEAYGIGVPVGGSGRLTDALVAAIRKHGGEVRAGVDVARVLVRNGRAAGVVTTAGEEIAARDAVVGAIHPHDLGRMVEGVAAPVAEAAARTRLSEIGCITVHAALKSPLKFKAGAHVGGSVMIELMPNRYETLRRSFDELRYGGYSPYPLVGLGSLTAFDPSRGPNGETTLHAWDYVPYAPPGGGSWDQAKGAYAERMIAHMGKFIDNLTADDILGVHVDSPLDMERTSSSFRRGDIHGVAPYSYQYGAHRPTPDLGQNTVPGVDRLYLVGPFQSPGGGVFGAGRAAAIRMFEDLKLNFDKAVAKAR